MADQPPKPKRTSIQSGPDRKRTALPVAPGRVFLLLIFLMVLVAVGVYRGVILPELTGADASEDSLATRIDLPWWLSDRVRQLEEDTDFYRRRVASLLSHTANPPERAGFHSETAPTPDRPQWVQVDLGREYQISEIALVPASVQQEKLVEGFAFPLKFRLEVSSDEEFRNATLVKDQTSTEYPAPGHYPLFMPGLSYTARYVRLTVTEHREVGGRAFFALGELVVLSGNRNVAAWRPVSSSGSVETPGRWSREYLVDGVSILPPPVSNPVGTLLSATDGYLVQPEQEGSSVWLQLDLGESHPIDEIRLVPARPRDVADLPGWGFPSAFRVEVASQADLSDAQPYAVYSSAEFHNDRPLVLPAESRGVLSRGAEGTQWLQDPTDFPLSALEARYVRVTATGFDPRLETPSCALSEIQVYSGDQNVAVDVLATASHTLESNEDAEYWGPEFLVDEFSSRARLLEYPSWLENLRKRRDYDERLAETSDLLSEEVNRVWMQLGAGVGLTLMITVGGMLWYTSWQTGRMQTQTVQLRNQIASDLHDDIGSNLGAIALLSQTIGIRDDVPDDLHSELEEIREVALETSDSMRDILWLMRTSTSNVTDFIGRLRSTTARMLVQCEVSFRESSDSPADVPIPLNWRRNVFLSFKEVLHNAARHSKATEVRIELDVDEKGMRIAVSDNGVGFDLVQRREGGLGINSISARTLELGGHTEFETSPGHGTTVTLEIPFVHPGNIWRTLTSGISRQWNRLRNAMTTGRLRTALRLNKSQAPIEESARNETHTLEKTSGRG